MSGRLVSLKRRLIVYPSNIQKCFVEEGKGRQREVPYLSVHMTPLAVWIFEKTLL